MYIYTHRQGYDLYYQKYTDIVLFEIIYRISADNGGSDTVFVGELFLKL